MRRLQLRRARAVLLVLPLILLGCGGDEDTSASNNGSSEGTSKAATDTGVVGEEPYGNGGNDGGSPADAAFAIIMEGFAYQGLPLTVPAGAVIEVLNLDSAEHDVDSVDGTSFNTDLLGQDERLTFKAPTTPGTYDFTCSNHSEMRGQLIVA